MYCMCVSGPFWLCGNRYQLMLSCWHSEPEARLNFTQLKYFFQSTIATNTAGGDSYITIQPDVCCVITTEDEPWVPVIQAWMHMAQAT